MDLGGEACLGLVDRVVDELEDHVMETRGVVGVTDVHAGAFADRLEAFQDLDAVGHVIGARQRLDLRLVHRVDGGSSPFRQSFYS